MSRWHRVAAILTFVGFLAATLGPLVTAVEAAPPCAMTMGDSSTTDSPAPQSKSMPVCDGNLSCIIMVAVPSAADLVATPVEFRQVRYWSSTAALAGLIIPPDPSPPKRSS